MTIALDAPDRSATAMAPRIEGALARGLSFHKENRLLEAMAAYDEVLSLDAGHTGALINKGAALRALGRPSEAMACYWQVLAVRPDHGEAIHNAANALLDMRRGAEAVALLKTALARAPQAAESWSAMGRALVRSGRRSAALACLRRARALAADRAAPALALGELLLETGQPEQALAEFTAARAMTPGSAAAVGGAGRALLALGRPAEAEAALRDAVAAGDGRAETCQALSRLRRAKGDRSAAWDEQAASQDLAGKTVRIAVDGPLADTLLLLRGLPALAAGGARVTLACPEPLRRLCRSVAGVAAVVAADAPAPAGAVTLPLAALGPRLEPAATAVPYLRAAAPPPALPVPQGTRLRVGLAWAPAAPPAGHADSAPRLEDLLPVTGMPGIAFFSLHTGPRAGEAKRLAHPALLADLAARLADLADMAAAIDALDLVITGDTAVAHLAGALGKPVWVLLPPLAGWPWRLTGETCPWYPTARLFRAATPGDWQPVTKRVASALAERLAATAAPTEPPLAAASVFPQADGRPRFRMTAPREFLADPGIRFLMEHERSGAGYEYATRSFLDAHLTPGDLFLDIGAHWGIMSLQAATRFPGQIRALAIEPAAGNLPHLRRWLADNGVAGQVEVIAAAAADRPGRGELRPESTMGHSLIRADRGSVAVVSIDQLLAERPDLQARRVIVKIDVEGHEGDVVQGMAGLLASGRVAAVIWERGIEYGSADGQKRLAALRARFAALGFTPWRFDSEDQGGPLVPFVEDGRTGNVVELAPGVAPQDSYGLPRPPTAAQPADPALDAAFAARRLFRQGLAAQKDGKAAEASACYAEAAALDPATPGLFNNLGVLLRGSGRHAAATAAYRRALAAAPEDTGVMANFGNHLRELGRLSAARALECRALALNPGDGGLHYNLAVVHKDDGRPEQALVCYDRALRLDPDNPDYRWDRALALLQTGNYAEGFKGYERRWGLKRAQKRKLGLPIWDGGPLAGRSLFLTDEQGFGDVLEFARFIPGAKARGAGRVVVECQPELIRLMALAPGVDAVVPRDKQVPDCDLQLPLLSLPGLFGTTLETLPATVPYLRAPAPTCVLPKDGRRKLGLVWAGKTTPRDRSCPLELLLPTLGNPRFALFSLQTGPHAADLRKLGGDAFITDLAPALSDFAETAAVLAQLDLLVTVDTAVAHLAGALGVPTFLLLRYTSDWRWFDRRTDSPWYPSMRLFRQQVPNRWDEPLEALRSAIGNW